MQFQSAGLLSVPGARAAPSIRSAGALCGERVRLPARPSRARPKQDWPVRIEAVLEDLPRYFDRECAEFEKWVSAGSPVPFNKSLAVAYVNGSRGVLAKRAIKEGDPVLFIAADRVLHIEAIAKEDASIVAAVQNLRDLQAPTYETVAEHVALAAYLHLARGREGGFYRPWLDFLPPAAEFENFTLHWTRDELLRMRGSRALTWSLHARHLHEEVHRRLTEEGGWIEAGDAAKRSFQHALLTVDSRCFAASPSRPYRVMMVPGADLLAHECTSLGPNAEFCTLGDGSFAVLAMRDIEPGEPVAACYGRFANAQLLVDSGFVVNGNVHDAVDIELGIADDDPLLHDKRRAMVEAGLAAEDVAGCFEVRRGGRLPRALVAFARIAVASSASGLADALRRARGGAGSDSMEEQLVKESVARVLRERLAAYPEGVGVPSDTWACPPPQEGIEDEPPSARRSRLSSVLVRGERAILQDALDALAKPRARLRDLVEPEP